MSFFLGLIVRPLAMAFLLGLCWLTYQAFVKVFPEGRVKRFLLRRLD